MNDLLFKQAAKLRLMPQNAQISAYFLSINNFAKLTFWTKLS
jgi:hypothetical protein